MKKRYLILIACIVAVSIGVPALNFQREKSRRRHQIGQVYMLIRFHCCPAHQDRYPNDLNELLALPFVNAPQGGKSFFERAVREVELVAPGVSQVNAPPDTVVLRERSPDRKGYVWIHLIDGSTRYQKQFPDSRP